MLMSRRLILAASLFLAAMTGAATGNAAMAAPTPDSAKALVDHMAGEAISTLAAPNRTDDQISTNFHDILKRNFDLPGIARFVLGRYWRVATPEQQAEYVSLFENYIVGIYANRFKQYSGETVSITGVHPEGDAMIVATTINLTRGAQPVAVNWHVEDGIDGAPRVDDVIIEQVSMSLTQRSEFATLIQNNGGKVEALLALLRAKTGANTGAQSTTQK